MLFENAGEISEKKVHISNSCPESSVIYYKNSDTPVMGSYIADMSKLHDMHARLHRYLI